jgi:hypothetical protein
MGRIPGAARKEALPDDDVAPLNAAGLILGLLVMYVTGLFVAA